MSGAVRLGALAVSPPREVLSQAEALRRLGLDRDGFAERVFLRSAIGERSLDLSPEMLDTNLQGRTDRVEDSLLEQAVALIEALELDPAEVGTVITATLYSLGGPTLAHRLIERFEMSPATDKYHITGVGCASAVPLFRLAANAVGADPSRKCLVVAADCMSGLLVRGDGDDPRAKTIGSAIFGDGCGVSVIEAGGQGPAVLGSTVHQVAGTLGAVRMTLAHDDSYLHLDRELPDIAAAQAPALVDGFLSSIGLRREQIDHWIVHPGGRRILDLVVDSLELTREQVQLAYDVLATRGNVGTASIFYVLSETLQRRTPRPGERGLMLTVGPGVTVGLLALGF